ncbi:MAG: hypothetical protein IJT94_06965 [Oscillibacter sp.]|nr:hypothetical protein [Oscillibacter sp.]
MNDFKKWLRRYRKRHEEYAGLIDTLLSDRKFPWDGTGQDMRRYLLTVTDSIRYPFSTRPMADYLFKILREEYEAEKADMGIPATERNA